MRKNLLDKGNIFLYILIIKIFAIQSKNECPIWRSFAMYWQHKDGCLKFAWE